MDPFSCMAPDILQFLQEMLEADKSPSTLRGMVAAIKAASEAIRLPMGFGDGSASLAAWAIRASGNGLAEMAFPQDSILIGYCVGKKGGATDQLVVCYRTDTLGQPVSKGSLSHWVVEAIQQAYKEAGITDMILTQPTVMAKLGEDATLSCQVMDLQDFIQATWKKVLPDGRRINIANDHRTAGPTVVASFKGKVVFKETGLKKSTIAIRRLTQQDVRCYVCQYTSLHTGSFQEGTTCIQLYELHEPILQIRESNSTEETVVSCSATGRPAPTVTLNVPQQDLYFTNSRTVSVTNANGTVTVTTTAVLPDFHGNDIQVRCTARLISGPEIQVFKTIPGLTDVILTQPTVWAKLGEDAHLSCQVMQYKDVLQVTWQKLSPEGKKKNLGNYNKYSGQTVNPGFQGKVEFKDAGLQNCSIVIKKAVEQDESCYLCRFSSLYSGGSLKGRTCLQVYELHEPILQIRESNSTEEMVVSCSATGRPAPTVTLNVPQQDLYFSNSSTVSVTNANGTVTVTTTAMLSVFGGNDTLVGCTARLLSVAEIQVFKTIPAIKTPADGFNEESGSN
ncbi:uncharacterized protein LOC128373903 [Scomber japonicus]|uniref:uncharacterized protein LOC128373903 n=1 Tax=Scomber japonicus TaxID=13676 RepID=UPI0023054127|nr:uncharacterized protein LOC128373903 [Scomber japonicus]